MDERKEDVVAAEGRIVFGDNSGERAEAGNGCKPRRGYIPAGPPRQVAQLEVEAEMAGEAQAGAGSDGGEAAVAERAAYEAVYAPTGVGGVVVLCGDGSSGQRERNGHCQQR